MKIEKIQKLKNGKYKLTLDSKLSITTYDEIIIDKMLFNNKEINNQILSEISLNNEYYDVLNKIIKMISTKFRSQKELELYLDKTSLNDNEKKRLIADLQKKGFINDLRYATCYAADSVNLSKNGPYKIRESLNKQGISEDIIEEVINNLDRNLIEENLINYIEKKNRLNHNRSVYELKLKLSHELINLGYAKDEIEEKLNQILKADDDITKKEYERLMKKYSKKYSGKELEYKVKQAMYQKGFNYRDLEC